MNEIVYQIVVPLEPKSKKNHMDIVYVRGRPVVVQNKQYKQFEKDIGKLLTHKPKEPIDYPVNCNYQMYRKTHRVFDASNGISALDDVLVKFGILKDDNFKIIAGHDGTRVRVDKENPRIEITITKMEAEDL